MQALTALSMVQPSQQWILNPGPLQEALAPETPYSDQAPAAASNRDSAKATLARCRAGLAHSMVVLSSSSNQTIASGYQCTDLTKQHAAAHAHVLLSHLDPEATQRATVDDDVFHQLLGLGEASQLCKVACLSTFGFPIIRVCIALLLSPFGSRLRCK